MCALKSYLPKHLVIIIIVFPEEANNSANCSQTTKEGRCLLRLEQCLPTAPRNGPQKEISFRAHQPPWNNHKTSDTLNFLKVKALSGQHYDLMLHTMFVNIFLGSKNRIRTQSSF
jgi:hypothetical protein